MAAPHPQHPTWDDVAAADLDVRTLYDVLALRSAVFVVEQECVYQDLDGLDLRAGTRHLADRSRIDKGRMPLICIRSSRAPRGQACCSSVHR